MAKAAIGAIVRYCGHMGTFIADIHEIDGVNVVHASQPVTMANLDRDPDRYERATHLIVDSPRCGFWRPHSGMFVVPSSQVTEVKEN